MSHCPGSLPGQPLTWHLRGERQAPVDLQTLPRAHLEASLPRPGLWPRMWATPEGGFGQ